MKASTIVWKKLFTASIKFNGQFTFGSNHQVLIAVKKNKKVIRLKKSYCISKNKIQVFHMASRPHSTHNQHPTKSRMSAKVSLKVMNISIWSLYIPNFHTLGIRKYLILYLSHVSKSTLSHAIKCAHFSQREEDIENPKKNLRATTHKIPKPNKIIKAHFILSCSDLHLRSSNNNWVET